MPDGKFPPPLIVSSMTDARLVGMAGRRVVRACYVLEDGTEIWYKPSGDSETRKPIAETCGRDDPFEDEQPLVREDKE